MAKENEELLKLTADAGQLKAEMQSARQAVASAMRDMEAATQAADLSPGGQQAAGTLAAFGFSPEESAAFAQQQDTANVLMGKTSQAVEELGKKAQISKRDLRDLAGGLGLVSPQLGGLVRMFVEAREGLGALSAHLGTIVRFGGPIAALALVFGELKETIDEANRAAAAFAEQQERLRRGGAERTEGVAHELGLQGKGSDAALNAASREAQKLEDRGFKKETAAKVAAALTGAGGELLAPEEDVDLFAAGVERGEIELGGKNAREQASNLRKAQRTVERQRGTLEESARAFTAPRRRQLEEAARASGRGAAAEEAVEIAMRREGLSREEAERRVRDVQELRRRGKESVLGGFEDEGTYTEIMQDYNTAVKRATGGGESARMVRVREAQELDAAILEELKRMNAHMARTAENTAKGQQVNVRVSGQSPAPFAASRTRSAGP